jgi:predicted phosphodiesterase
MTILIVSDLHNRWDWFDWVAARRADLTLVAGDLLDEFDDGGILAQILRVEEWCRGFQGALALCSGNHDANAEALSPQNAGGVRGQEAERLGALLMHEHWMDALERPSLVTDRRSSLLSTSRGEVLLTTCPYAFDPGEGRQTTALWRQGAALSQGKGKSGKNIPWIVLHHDPPESHLVGGPMGDPDLPARLRDPGMRPDFLVSGHLHEQPYIGSFAEKIGSTWCFNPGHPDPQRAVKAKVPNHIELDLKARTATWNASGRSGSLRRTISLT